MNGLVLLNLLGFVVNSFFFVFGMVTLSTGGDWGVGTLTMSMCVALLNLVAAFIVSD